MTGEISEMGDRHAGARLVARGVPLEEARFAMVLVHGRGASAESILDLADEFRQPDFAYLAPEAAGNSWYPCPFLAPIKQNEPWLSSALGVLDNTVRRVMERIPAPRVVLLGFSQGACLSLEFAVRHPRRFGGVVGLSGGLIGPDGTARDYAGSMEGTPIFLGCSDVDFHIPRERVDEAAAVFRRLGAHVTARLYPGMGHTVNADEITNVRGILSALRTAESGGAVDLC